MEKDMETLNDITIREMKPAETATVAALGKRSFAFFEGLWISAPKEALVAVCGDRIVGALLYKILRSGRHTVGYVDYIFIDPAYHGRGIGNILCRHGVTYLTGRGCDALSALVKDDNVASWAMFESSGFVRVGIPALVRTFGVGGMLKQYFAIPYFVGIGMDYYVLLPGQQLDGGKGGSVRQIASFLLANLALGCVTLPKWPGPAMYAAAYGLLLCLSVVAGFWGTLPSKKRKWTFRFTNGGAVISLLVNLVALYPMIGRWCPRPYERTDAFGRDMGLQALFDWLAMLAVCGLALLLPGVPLLRWMGQIAGVLALYRCIPIYPFESFGGRRVWTWHRGVFAGMAVLSVVLFLLVS